MPLTYYLQYALILLTTHPNRVRYELDRLRRRYGR